MRGDYGVSGLKLYVPRPRVKLEDWCEWTGNSWGKVSAVVGRSFRMKAPYESIYTMAANAVLRLILDYDVDPARVGYLAFGTESSTDNAAGAVIVKGMVDRALAALGRPPLSRNCEVPEFKHACLGGIYAMKSALRYLACDGDGRQAIVVCGDIAEYERGSSGEPTQGAGAVAALLEERPRLLSTDVRRWGSAASYRGPDFRKPFARHFVGGAYGEQVAKLHDFPVFSGKYSTVCYIDSTLRAVEDMLAKLRVTPRNFYHEVEAVFFHRPYHRMPVNAMAALYAWGLSQSEAHLPELRQLCELAGVELDRVLTEMRSRPDLFEEVLAGRVGEDVYPQSMEAVRRFRKTDKFEEVVSNKMAYGSSSMKDLGNLYSAALPAWLAAGFDEAAGSEVELADKQMLAVGYGSGDASEAMPFCAVDGWQQAASRIGFERALAEPIDLTREQYEALHDRGELDVASLEPKGELVVDRIGETKTADFSDLGIEYYRYVV